MRPIFVGLSIPVVCSIMMAWPSNEVQIEVSVSADGIHYVGDRVLVKVFGPSNAVLLAVEPDGSARVVAEQDCPFEKEITLPVTSRGGVVWLVAFGLGDGPREGHSEPLPNEFTMDQVQAALGADSTMVVSLGVEGGLRPFAGENTAEALAQIAKMAHRFNENGNTAGLAFLSDSLVESLAESGDLSLDEAMIAVFVHQLAQEPVRAFEVLKLVSTNGPREHDKLQYIKGLCLLAIDQFSDAATCFEEIAERVDSDSEMAFVYVDWALCRLAMQDPRSVVTLASKHVDASDGFSDVEVALAAVWLLALIEMSDTIKAKDLIASVIADRGVPKLREDFAVIAAGYCLRQGWRDVAASFFDDHVSVRANAADSFWNGFLMAPQYGRRAKILKALSEVGRADMLLGFSRVSEARESLLRSVEYFEAIEYRGTTFRYALLLVARCHLMASRVTEAGRLATRCLELDRHAAFPSLAIQAESLYLLALVNATNHDTSAAVEFARKARATAIRGGEASSNLLSARSLHVEAFLSEESGGRESLLRKGVALASNELVLEAARISADSTAFLLWQYLSFSRRPPSEVYEVIGPFAARTADGEEPWLAADAALVDIFYYERLDGLYGAPTTRRVPSYVAFVRVGDRVERIELGEAEQIDAKVAAWRKAMSRHESGTAEAEEVARRVWAPLAAALPENLATLYLCADWELGVLPWEALPDAGRQVIDRCHIARLPASRTQRLVQQFQAVRSQVAALPAEANGEATLVVGDVDYGRVSPDELLGRAGKQPSAYYWRPLPGAKGEVDLVAKVASSRGSARVLRAGEAAKAQVLAELPHATLAHFATHGYANADLGVSAQRSTGGVADTFGLALADANRAGPDGLLSATEVGRLQLPRLSLAVLSGCETGVAHRRVQFLSNLPRAFHQAGAKHVLASMWQVDDEATRVMMERFYHHYLGSSGTADPSRALRAAQLEMRRRPRDVERALASRAPDFAAGPRKLEFDGSDSTLQLPDWVWAPWFVSSMSFSEPLASRASGLAPATFIRQGGAGVDPALDASPTPSLPLELP